MNDSGATREMPRYKCHKEVHALKIAAINRENSGIDGMVEIIPADEGFLGFKVDREYDEKHKPQPCGYYVVYADGYQSFSPAQAFEEGYTRVI